MRIVIALAGTALAVFICSGAAETAQARYPALAPKPFLREVARNLAVVDEAKTVHTEEWIAETCLRAAASRFEGPRLSPASLRAGRRIRLTPEMEEFFDECLAQEGYAYRPGGARQPSR